jgi:glycosyltransferase involved in cell wall biosynthesis
MSTDCPQVSIVTPIYNTAGYLAECVESVLRQTYENWEYILLDNCSTDGSDHIAEGYAASDRRIQFFRNKDFLSQAQNYNSALSRISSKSKYCKIVQADDWIYPECVERMVAVADSDPSVGLVSSYRLEGKGVHGSGLPYSTQAVSGREIGRLNLLAQVHLFGTPTALLYRSEIVRKLTPFFDEQSFGFDADTCYRILLNWNFGFVHQVLSFHRADNSGITSRIRRFDPFDLDDFIFLGKYGRFYFTTEESTRLFKAAERDYLRSIAKRLLPPAEKSFWEYHRRGLKTMNYELRWITLAKPVLLEVLDLLGNPKNTSARLGRLVRRKIRTKRGEDRK